MGRMEGKVALITGAARGQGRSHALRLAEEGADIIALDICDQIDTVAFPMSTPDDLKETVRLVESLDRRIVGRQADVRNDDQLNAVVEEGLSEFGHIDTGGEVGTPNGNGNSTGLVAAGMKYKFCHGR